ncbi:MAG TPA: amidohydrolase family protein [Propioniciclava sp.]|jgi:imidazolonepropionase-like amidohydrolase|uniref:amidohydrolase family protein n=1 Tax=Propioniciclava sp. TaxID=2038686 RepID=UPI002CBD01D1|nr:amidohydrolase family protein [Propioniciclava sp.]HRL50593.1 amidohydrolase family protein [Propioniciclava sp.]HRL81539.1 amidohydrolase family protein [Propioniciclava sp.]
MPSAVSFPRGVEPLAGPGPRVITAERLISAPGDPVIDRGAVVIEDGTIAWVGPIDALPATYAEYPVTRHERGTILPGLVETHAHLGSYAQVLPQTTSDDRHDESRVALSSVAIARQLASVGVTTVQSLGSRYFADVALRDAIGAGLIAGPRIVAAGPQLTTSAGHAWSTGGEVDSITEIRKAVRDHHKAGVDVIKVMATGGFMTARTAPWNAQFTTDELRALVEDAHRLGKHTAAHAHGTEGIRRAVEAGIDYIAHASFVDADGQTRFDHELADLIAEKGVYVDTCSPPSWPEVPGETVTPRAWDLYQHGVKIVTGNDIGAVWPPSGFTFALKQLEASGLPREEVLRAATSRAAAAVGLGGVAGVLAPGYAADLIVADGDPLADLGALDHLLEIVIDGRTFTPDPIEPFVPERDAATATNGSHPNDVRATWHTNQQRRLAHEAGVAVPTA